MTGLEKMKSQILNEAELSAKKILDEAKQDAEKVMQTAKERWRSISLRTTFRGTISRLSNGAATRAKAGICRPSTNC